MDYCLLEDAFQQNINCKDNSAFEKQQRHEKKKYKKSKDCFKTPVDPKFNPEATDPDRPALDAKQYSEAFQNIEKSKIPNVQGAIKSSPQLPSYFTGNEDDDLNIEGFVGDFDKAKVEMGFEKVSGESNQLPLPSLDDNWKPLTPATNNSAYFKSLPTPGGTYPLWNKLNYEPRVVNNDKNNNSTTNNNITPIKSTDDTLQTKIDELVKRLDVLEKEYDTPHLNNQQEIIAFVGTGIFMIFTLSLLRC